MRRKYLLSAAMLSVLLATSACGAGSPAPVASSQPARPAGSDTGDGSGTGDGSTSRPEIGISQWNAAESARKAKTKPAAAAAKAEPAAKTPAAAAKAEPAAKTKPATAAKAKSAEKAAAAAKATAAYAAAAEKAAAAAAAAAGNEAAAKKKAAAAKTRPAAGALKRAAPVHGAPKTAPAPVRQGSAEEIVGSACGAADTLFDTLKGSVTVSDPALPGTGVGTGTDAGTTGEFRCLD